MNLNAARQIGEVLTSAGLGFVVFDDHLRYLVVNETAAVINGVPAVHHLGRRIDEVVPGVPESFIETLRECLATGRPGVDVEVVGTTPASDEERSWQVNLGRLNARDIEGWIVVVVFVETTARRLDETLRWRQTQRTAALARLSAALAASVDSASIVDTIVSGASDAVGCSFVNVAMADHATRTVQFQNPSWLDADIARAWDVVPLDGVRSPLHDAMHTGELVVVVDHDERLVSYPHLVDDTITAGLVTTAAVPLRVGGELIGAIGFGWNERTEIDTDEQSRLRLLGDICAEALKRARTTDAASNLVKSLMLRLLDPSPTAPGLDVAAIYRAAETDVRAGGDWYDVITIDDHRTAVVVGDIVGHGVEAASLMAIAKSVVRTLVIADPGLGSIAAIHHRAIGTEGDYLGTAIVAVVDTDAQTVALTSFGHPPAMVRRPGGVVEQLPSRSLMPLGFEQAAAEPVVSDLPEGSTLVLYTDGLIERGRAAVDLGLSRLSSDLASLPADASAADVARHLVDASSGYGTSIDDIAIVVLKYRRDR